MVVDIVFAEFQRRSAGEWKQGEIVIWPLWAYFLFYFFLVQLMFDKECRSFLAE